MKLVGTDGNRLYTFDLAAGMHDLGRSADRALCVPDKTVSRNHALIEVSADGEEIFLTDLESHNGTRVNSTAVRGRVQIKPGDVIHFGQTEFKLRSNDGTDELTSRPTAALFAENEPEKSVVLPISEALLPLPSKVTDRAELYPTLTEMASILVLPEPQEVMLERSLKLVNQVIPAERLAVLMVGEDDDELFVAASLLPGGRDLGEFTLSKTIAKEIMENKSAVLIGDSRSDPRFAEQASIIMSALKSAMAVPLFDQDRVLGILYVDSSSPLHRYNDDYLRLLATFGNIIAARLMNYELLHERHEKQLYEAELKRASDIQENLLPRSNPELPGYQVGALQQQCRAVGGDLYDMAALPDGRLALVVADVSGKGLGAALLMSNILASFRILYNITEFSLTEVVSMVSRQLFCSSAASDFATLFVGVIDPKTHRLSYINAGHNPPVLVRADGSQELLEPSGTMIGAFDLGTWSESTVEMCPGDVLLVFTDGVTEADRGDELYSEERLEKLLPALCCHEPDILLRTIMDDIASFVGDAPRSDDITMLAIKRTGE